MIRDSTGPHLEDQPQEGFLRHIGGQLRVTCLTQGGASDARRVVMKCVGQVWVDGRRHCGRSGLDGWQFIGSGLHGPTFCAIA